MELSIVVAVVGAISFLAVGILRLLAKWRRGAEEEFTVHFEIPAQTSIEPPKQPPMEHKPKGDFVPREPASQSIDPNVQFTVYRPSTVAPERWYVLLAFAHLSKRRPDAPPDEPDPVEEIGRQAEIILKQTAAEYQPSKLDRGFAVPRKGLLTFVPLIDGFEFNPPTQSVRWQKTWHKVEFDMKASASVDGQDVEGQMSVYLGNILLAEVPLRITVNSQYVEPKNKQPILDEASAEPYRKIFASYSHKDTEIVEDFETYVAALGDQYLRDVKTLRAGQVWSEELQRMIRDANVFQLFWSSNSMPSKFVRQEWEYALSLKRPRFIRPIYWEEPLPETKPDLPPDELRRLHFYKFPRGEEADRRGVVPPTLESEQDNASTDMASTVVLQKPGKRIETWEELTQSTAREQEERRRRAEMAAAVVEMQERSHEQSYRGSDPLPRAKVNIPSAEWGPQMPAAGGLPQVSPGLFLIKLVGAAILAGALLAGIGYVGYRIWFAESEDRRGAQPDSPSPGPPSSPTAGVTPKVTPEQSPTKSVEQVTPTPPIPSGQGDLKISVDPTVRSKRGDTGDYYITLRNEGSSEIKAAELTEHLPADLEYVHAEPRPILQQNQYIVWRFPELGQKSTTIKVTIRLRRSLKPGESLTTEQVVSYVDGQGNQRTSKSVLTPVTAR